SAAACQTLIGMAISSLGCSKRGRLVAMPMQGLLDAEGAVFDPEDIKAIAAAFDTALERLKVTDRKSAMAHLVAKTVIQIAKEGERDPERVSEKVIRLLRDNPQAG